MRRAVACFLALAGIAVATPAHAFLLLPDRGSLPADVKLLNRLRADEAVIALVKAPGEPAYRDAIRDEQSVVYGLAADQDLEALILPRLSQDLAAPMQSSVDALRALYRLAGVEQSSIKPRFSRALATPAGLADLLAYYQDAGRRYGMDWTYLASINFIESDFGRVMGPSSAGALGPMQFMPSTWDNYGDGGDVMSPHDSIYAAARYLVHYGAPNEMEAAIWHYNHDYDYVAAVSLYASAIRADQTWLARFYVWSTRD
jgi:soluble lytic murein transglycosylase-like protein